MNGMKLFKLIVEIRYSDDIPEPFQFREKILSTIASEEIKRQKNVVDGFGMLIKKRNAKVAIESNRTAVDIVIASSITNSTQYAKENLVKVFKHISKAIEFKNIERIGVRGNWLQYTNFTEKKLVEKFKNGFYKETPISKNAHDVSVAMTLSDGENLINYMAAPLTKTQLVTLVNANLKEFGHQEEDITADTAIYIDFDYFNEKKMKYTDELLTSFISKSLEVANAKIKTTLEIIN